MLPFDPPAVEACPCLALRSLTRPAGSGCPCLPPWQRKHCFFLPYKGKQFVKFHDGRLNRSGTCGQGSSGALTQLTTDWWQTPMSRAVRRKLVPSTTIFRARVRMSWLGCGCLGCSLSCEAEAYKSVGSAGSGGAECRSGSCRLWFGVWWQRRMNNKKKCSCGYCRHNPR